MSEQISTGNDYEAFLRRIRGKEGDNEGTYVTLSAVVLPRVLTAQLCSAKDVATAMYILGAYVWSEPTGELEGLHILRASADLGSVDAVRALGDALNWMGLYEESMPVLKTALQNEPHDARLHGLLGLSMYELHLDEDAQFHLRTGLQADPLLAVPLAQIRRRAGDESEYRDLITEAARLNVYGAHVLAGNLLAEQGDNDQAMELYRQGILSGDAHSAFNLACLLYEVGRMEDARQEFVLAREMGDLRMSPFDQMDG
ncbi:tetratricopeptide repeat protein [Microbacterium testaceum]|uniref:tetratricopeptide repeat protein n=1 Tax=Microbacterium testaceum TaxID=2033 RepID=UPI000AEE6D71|nr:hypothetical protein [Microbacterium testaceum]